MIVGITGATGFIGRRVIARLLERGDTVRVLTRDPSLRIEGVIPINADLAIASVDQLVPFTDGLDVLLHCAGVIRDPTMMHAVHVAGTQRLAHAAHGRVGRWVQLSSVGVYGPHRSGLITEETPERPIGDYEVTKALSDRIVLDAGGNGAFDAIVVRPSNVFGIDMVNNYLRQLVAMVQRNLFVFIGEPGASANFIHVESVVDSLVLATDVVRPAHRVYNVSEHMTLEQFVDQIASALGLAAPRRRIPEGVARLVARAGTAIHPEFPLTPARVDALTLRSSYPADRLIRDLSFVPSVPIVEGIIECARAWRRPV